MSAPVQRFQGGGGWLLVLGVLSVFGLGATAAGAWWAPQRVAFAYQFAWVYWFGIATHLLLFLAIFHASRARWPVVFRRGLEVLASTTILLPILFIPVVFGMEQVFMWAGAPVGLPMDERYRVAVERPYLNVSFFLARAAFYFVIWSLTSELLLRFSRRQDLTADVGMTVYQRYLGAGALPFLGFSISFAVLDWVMSLLPGWSSTLFPLYYFGATMPAAIAVLTIVCTLARGPDLFGGLLLPTHFASLAKFLLGFTAFYAYLHFFQYMLIWEVSLPTEVPWYRVRTTGGWENVAVFILAGRFAFPFFLLLSADLKRRRSLLAIVAAWIAFAHAVEVYWMVLPTLNSAAPRPHWADFTAFIGVGATLGAFAVFRMRGHYAVPIHDPYLEQSMEYSHP